MYAMEILYMNELGSLLSDAKHPHGLVADLRASNVVRKNWDYILGAMLAEHIQFEYVKQQQCVVSVHNPCWYSEIQAYKTTILEKINQIVKRRKKITEIKITMIKPKQNLQQPFANKTNYDKMIGL